MSTSLLEEHKFQISEVRDFANSKPGTNIESSFEKSAEQSWDENIGMRGAYEALFKGVKRERLVSLAAKVRRHIRMRETSSSEQVLSRGGRMIDRQRYRRGAPKCFWEDKTRRRPNPVVNIGFSIAANCGVSSDVWIQRGAALLSLLNEAQSEGVSVALDACMPVEGMVEDLDQKRFIRVRIKKAEELVSQGVLNFWVAHSAAFRRIGFRIMEEVAARMGKEMGFGYGRSIYEDENIENHVEDFDLWIPNWTQTKESEEVVDIAIDWTNTVTESNE